MKQEKSGISKRKKEKFRHRKINKIRKKQGFEEERKERKI